MTLADVPNVFLGHLTRYNFLISLEGEGFFNKETENVCVKLI
jgi:hypothetical protein